MCGASRDGAHRQFNRFLNACVDYRALGGIDGRYPEVKKWLSEVLPNFPVYAHMLGNFSVRIDGVPRRRG
jgi:hypothetical protein